MKYIIALLSTLTITTIGVNIKTDNIEPVKQITERSVENIPLKCTAYQPIQNNLESDDSQISFDHCNQCGYGVFLPNKQDEIVCTYCQTPK